MSALRWVVNGGAALAALGVLTLGSLWAGERMRHREPPRWSGAAFVPLRGDGVPPRWVMPVNPSCGSCMSIFARVHEAWMRRSESIDIAALIVDTPARPGPHVLRAIPARDVWWDRANAWRGRWGHGLYGELIEFHPDGRARRTIGPGGVLRAYATPAGEDTAPASHPNGGM